MDINSDGFIIRLQPGCYYERFGNGYVHEPYILRWMMALLRPGDVVIDGGASIGLHTLQLSRRVGPGGSVWSFEPDAVPYNHLNLNISRNGCKNVFTFNLALADREGMVTLGADGENSDNNSFFDMGGIFTRSCYVRTVTLDDILPTNLTVSLIKLDLEGAEIMALSGAKNVINRSPRANLIMEIFPGAIETSGWTSDLIEDLLCGLGFTNLYALADSSGLTCREVTVKEVMDRTGKGPRDVTANVLCTRGEIKLDGVKFETK